MEIAAVLDERRKLRGAVGDRERLCDGRKPQRRERRDLGIGQPQLLVEIGVADRRELVDAGDRKAGGNFGVVEGHRGEVAARGPAGYDDRPRADAMLRTVGTEPVECAPDLTDDLA